MMREKKIKVRKPILFTKSRPHKDLKKYNRKPKYKLQYEN